MTSLLFKNLSCHFPIQSVWIGLHFLFELLDVPKEYRLYWSEILDSTFSCVRRQLQISSHLFGNETNLTQGFFCRSDKLVIGLHLLLFPVSTVVKSQHVPYLLIVQILFKKGRSNALSRIISRRHARSVEEYRCYLCTVHYNEIVGLITCW